MDDLWSEMEKQFIAVLKANNIDEVYLKYEELGIMMRVDKSYWPTRMRGATITKKELEKVRSVKNIIRQGRIKEISSDSIVFPPTTKSQQLSAPQYPKVPGNLYHTPSLLGKVIHIFLCKI